MSFQHIAHRASEALGLEVQFKHDRRYTGCELVSNQDALVIGLPEGVDLAPDLVDVDAQHRGMILEVTQADVCREPNFDLMLTGTRRVRYVVLPDESGGWGMWPADAAQTVEEVLEAGGRPRSV